MSQKTHSQDSNFEEIWKKMDEIEPLTSKPSKEVQNSIDAYIEAAKIDDYLFGDYDGYEAYGGSE